MKINAGYLVYLRLAGGLLSILFKYKSRSNVLILEVSGAVEKI